MIEFANMLPFILSYGYRIIIYTRAFLQRIGSQRQISEHVLEG